MAKFDPVTGLREGSFGFGVFEKDGRKFPGLVQYGGGIKSLSGMYHDTHELLEDWERAFDKLVDLDAQGHASDAHFSEIRPLSPVQHPNIHGGGSNFKKHVTEMLTYGPYSKRKAQPGETEQQAWDRNAAFVELRAKHGYPIIWTGMHSSLCGAHDDIILPLVGKNHDWEMELGVVIGKSRRYANLEEAAEMIAGYVAINDLCSLDQFARPDMPWGFDFYVKNQPTFKVCGPFIVPAVFVNPTRGDIQIKLEVNGDPKQDWPVSDQIFNCEKMVAYASERTNLMAGDLILTGSPPGNGSLKGDFLKDGDLVTASLTGLGRQRNRCVQEILEPGRNPVYGTYVQHESLK